jgi:hypothetical protein
MTPGQTVGKLLNEVSAITAIVNVRISNGSRPTEGPLSILPCINFYEMPGGYNRYGMQHVSYSINCRSVTAETALTLARLVDETFGGSCGSGTYGYASNVSVFGIARAFTERRQGLIPEPDDGIYNAPVDVFMVFPNSSIS